MNRNTTVIAAFNCALGTGGECSARERFYRRHPIGSTDEDFDYRNVYGPRFTKLVKVKLILNSLVSTPDAKQEYSLRFDTSQSFDHQ